MNEYLKTLYDQIGKAAFFMMNARQFTIDNEQNALEWTISGSSVSSVRVAYDFGEDLYSVAFMTQTLTHLSKVIIERVEVGELHATIERVTGLSLSIPQIRLAH